MPCGSLNPDLAGVTCIASKPNHPDHYATVDGEPTEWPNPDFVPPVGMTSKAAVNIRIRELGDRIPSRATSAPVPDAGPAIRAGVRGQQQADAHADEAWKVRARETIVRLLQEHPEFNADMMWVEGGLDRPRESRALGPIISWARRQGYIEKTDRFIRSSQEQCHGMPREVWRSMLYAHSDA